MAWTNQQKQIAVRACKAARISDEQRRDMILRHFEHATMTDGRISSTSLRLTNEDFEQFMAIVESHAGGQVLHFTRDYWRSHAQDHYARMRHRVASIARQLESAGALHPGGVGLSGWISKRVTQGACDSIEQLDYHGLLALMISLTSYARQRGVALQQDQADTSAKGMESHECASTH